MCRIENYLFYVTIDKEFIKRRGDRVKQYNIPIEATLEIIGGKWKVVILCHLTKGTKRTSELQRLIPEISVRMLTQRTT